MAISEPLASHARAGTADGRLRIVEELEARRERNRIWSLLFDGALSVRRRIALVGRVVRGSGVWRRLASWWSRLRSLLRPARAALRRAGVALPVWLATSGPGQRFLAHVANAIGRGCREAAFVTSDAVTWLVWRFGETGQSIARGFGFAVERAILTVERFTSVVAGWLQHLHGDRWYVALAHDLVGLVAGLQVAAGWVPGPWQVAILLAGAAAVLVRHQGPLTEAWVRLRANRVGTLALVDGVLTVPQQAAGRPRPARPRSRSRSGQRSRRR